MAPSAVDVFDQCESVSSFDSFDDSIKDDSHHGKYDRRSSQPQLLLHRNSLSLPLQYGYGAGQVAKDLVKRTLEAHVATVDSDSCEAGEDDAFFVADMGEVYRQHLRWKLNLPRVKPHYAVKCNPDREVLRLLAALGNGFDCASKAEIDQVLALGVDPSRIIFANPCKTKSHVRHAAACGVRQTTFDNADELHKIKALYPDAELYLRILTDDSASMCRLSQKFGASLDAADELLGLAQRLGLRVVGVSFHVGSGASDPGSFVAAVRDARAAFDMAAAHGHRMHTLDVGGGFTGDALFEDMAAALSGALDLYFPTPSAVRVIAEPGRYFVAAAYTLACNVVARRAEPDPATGSVDYKLYLNDGVYGNFSSIIFDHQNPVAQILSCRQHQQQPVSYSESESDSDSDGEDYRRVQHNQQQATRYSLWGPTCDGIDLVSKAAYFPTCPRPLDVGDWLFFEDMGAYTRCSATRFNGFSDAHRVIYVSSEPGAAALMNY